MSEVIMRRRWAWIGHLLRMDTSKICVTALTWTPEGKRRLGRPKTTWRRTVETERNSLGWNGWGTARTVARDRTRWKDYIGALCANGHEEDRWGEVMSRQIHSYSKFQVNIWKDGREKSGKGNNSCKSRSSATKLELDLYYVKTNSYIKFQVNIWKDRREKSGKFDFSKLKGNNSCKSSSSATKLEPHLYYVKTNSYTKFQVNIWEYDR